MIVNRGTPEGRTIDRLRYTRSSLEQIKTDYSDLLNQWEKLEMEGVAKPEIPEIDDLMRLLSWLKGNIDQYRKLLQGGIEGVLSGELDSIEKDMEDKEIRLKRFLLSVSRETE